MGFVRRATVDAAAALAAVALGATWVAGPGAGIGVLAGGVIAVGNLWWLALRAVATTAAPRGAAPTWSLSVVVRFAALAGAVAVVLASGLVHPVAVVAGLTILPAVLIVRGLVEAGAGFAGDRRARGVWGPSRGPQDNRS